MDKRTMKKFTERAEKRDALIDLALKQGNTDAANIIRKHTKPRTALDDALALGAPHIAPVLQKIRPHKYRR